MSYAQEKAFKEIKKCLISSPTLALYECNRLGGCVLQQQDDESWKAVAYFSRASTYAEAHYSPIEKECLGFTGVCERGSDCILGKPTIGETDHKPLLPMLTTHHLDQLPPRIQRFNMRLTRFNIESMVHVPGKEMYAPDTLSRMLARNTSTVHKSKNADDLNVKTDLFVHF